MTRKKATIYLAVLAVLGSIITFYLFNLLLSDLSNMFYGVHDCNIISSIPGAMIIADVIAITLYVTRIYRRPEYKKSIILLYTTLIAIFSLIGIAFDIMTWKMIYGDLFAPFPFPCYTLITLIAHVASLLFSIVKNIKTRKYMEDDKEKRKKRFGYIIYSILMAGLVFFSFDRFGAFLISPLYMNMTTFVMTIPFYLSLLLPISLLVIASYYTLRYDQDNKNKNFGVVYVIVVLIVNVVLAALVAIIGMNNTLFISVISPALAIERLATLPVDTVLHHAVVLIYGLYELRYVLKKSKGKEVKSALY